MYICIYISLLISIYILWKIRLNILHSEFDVKNTLYERVFLST